MYDTIRVRHGLMLVGGAMGGKSTIVDTLALALTLINDKTTVSRINPKSVSIGRLYGDFELISRDW